ncbi:MAG TPA: tetratricopeptide repeat protein [Rhizomicrobium sp.]|nr:tetratricopeptide repeat protein [Rhizomicrobium sp.]
MVGLLLSAFTSPIGLIDVALLVFFVWHAIRHGNVWPWLYVMILIPGIGMLIYFFVEILPPLMRGRGAQTLKRNAARAIDPGRSMREALRDAEITGSVDSRRKLAEEYLARGNAAEAVALYHGMLEGQFRDDPVLWLGYARAQFAAGDAAGAQASLDELQRVDPKFQSGEAHLLYARALEAQGRSDEALAEYERLVRYFSGEEARCRYAMALERAGRRDEARAIYQQVAKSVTGAPKHYRQTQKEWGDIAARALKA